MCNESRYSNECPNLDVNYSVRLIIICLMSWKWKGCHRMMYVWWCENWCVCCVCAWERARILSCVYTPVLHQLVNWPPQDFLVSTAQYVVNKHCMQCWLLRHPPLTLVSILSVMHGQKPRQSSVLLHSILFFVPEDNLCCSKRKNIKTY